MSLSPEQLKAAEEEWVHRVFAEIDEMEEDGLRPSRKDAQWLAGRKLQAELNSAKASIALWEKSHDEALGAK